jgi:hypothetical protein
LDLSEPDSPQSLSARLTPMQEPSSESTGPTCPATETSTRSPQADWIGMESAESTSCAEAIPASLSPMPGSREATKILATSGRRCAELLAKSDPLGSLLRMLLVTSPWGSTRCSLIWKPMATPGGRLLFRLVPSMPRTSGNESGSWLATATATANQLCPSMRKWKGCREIWPTPTSRDWKDGTAQACANVPTNSLLGREVHLYPTPRPCSGETSSGMNRAEFYRAMGFDPSTDTKGGANQSPPGGSLNPTWVEWLMGFPPEWTALDASETPSSRKSSR